VTPIPFQITRNNKHQFNKINLFGVTPTKILRDQARMGNNKSNGIKTRHYDKTIVMMKDEQLTEALKHRGLYEEWLTLDGEDRPNDPDAPNIVVAMKALVDLHGKDARKLGNKHLKWDHYLLGGLPVK